MVYEGSRGLGLHTATAFLLAGAEIVFITARKLEGEEGINQAVEKLNNLPAITGKAIGIAANVAKTEEIQILADKIKGISKHVDILVCNAGATWGGPFEPTPDSSTQKVLDLNVRGVFNLARLYVTSNLSLRVTDLIQIHSTSDCARDGPRSIAYNHSELDCGHKRPAYWRPWNNHVLGVKSSSSPSLTQSGDGAWPEARHLEYSGTWFLPFQVGEWSHRDIRR